MKENLSFMLRIENEGDAKRLNKLLNTIGAKCYIRHSGVQQLPYLEIEYDTKEVLKKTNRNAGRKTIRAKGIPLVYEIRQMQKTMTNDEIAKNLGISRATFYRRLKEHKKYPDNDNSFF